MEGGRIGKSASFKRKGPARERARERGHFFGTNQVTQAECCHTLYFLPLIKWRQFFYVFLFLFSNLNCSLTRLLSPLLPL